ncbi:hypothetical protein [Pseudarthrobacter sp. S9]|uniref:hypothetical protein n=1 Tax=Pseudarthrobacter sp. S9 TaxID=3418421 RepID=UPI003CFD3D8E
MAPPGRVERHDAMREIIRWADSTAVRRELMLAVGVLIALTWTGREIGHRSVQYGQKRTREASADWDRDGHRDAQQASLTIRRDLRPGRTTWAPRSPEATPRLPSQTLGSHQGRIQAIRELL